MTPTNLEINALKIFTLNCWGLRYVSDHRQVRIKLIAQHLVENDYDVVFLQEVWIQSDFEYIRTKTKFKYRFAHMFNNASLLGTSGLVILAKWVPKLIHFHPYSINGSPFRPFHGDWFSTKGVAYVRIELIGLNLHLFCTHMHAQYDTNEKIIDQYSVHRICQAYELGKFINLMACNCANTSSKDLIILAGDMNTSSRELPYRLLMELTDLNDCYKWIQYEIKKQIHHKNNNLKKINRSKIQEIMDESSDEEIITCGHRDNTFTPHEDKKAQKSGKRIDFIFYKIRDPCSNIKNRTNRLNDALNILKNHNQSTMNESPKVENSQYLVCLPEKVIVKSKDTTGLSFSDHQPVVTRLNFCWKPSQEDSSDEKNEDDDGPRCTNDVKCNVPKLGMKPKRKNNENECNHPLYDRWKDSTLIQEIEGILCAYIEKFQPSFKYSICVILSTFILFLVILAVMKFIVNLTVTETFLITLIFFIVIFIALLLKFITHRTEINAVKAILNDIHRKKTFHPDYVHGVEDISNTENSYNVK